MNALNQLSVITDEISQNFEHALDVAKQFGIESVEIREIWNKNITLFTDEELSRLKNALEKRNMKICVISSPFGKCVLPNSRFATDKKESFSRNPKYNLSFFERIVEIADFLGTSTIRIFPFLKFGSKNDEKTYENVIHLLQPYVEKAEKMQKILVLENEHVCFNDTIKNTVRIFDEIYSKALKLNLDPGNFYSAKELTDPESYEYFYEQDLIGHMHVKDPKYHIPLIGSSFGVIGEGKIDYLPLFKQALTHGYSGFFSLETHSLRNKEEISKKNLQILSQWLSDI